MKQHEKGRNALSLVRLGLAAWIAFWPAANAFAAADATTTATASGTVATVFSIAVSGNITLGSIPADNVTYTADQTNTVTAKNNEDLAWYLKLKVGAAVTGATLNAKTTGGVITAFTALTTVNQTFQNDTATPFINTPGGIVETYTYQAKTDGTLTGAASVSWTITYTLTQTV